MNATIHLPMRTRTVSDQRMNPYFDVSMQKYLREDGTDDGLRAIVNGLTGKTMGSVSKGYNLTTHKEASDLIKDFLNETGVPFESEGGIVGTAGAKYFERLSFPQFMFTPKGESTALDIKNYGAHDRMPAETMVPYITIKNSYDKTSRISWAYGIARLICSNGMAIVSSEDTFMSYRHNQKIDFMKVKDHLISRLEENVNLIQIAYDKLNGEDGLTFLRTLIDGEYPDKFKLAVLEKVAPYATVESTTIEDSETGRKTLKITNVNTSESAWAVYNIATDVASHTLTSPVDQDRIGRRIAKQFQIGVA